MLIMNEFYQLFLQWQAHSLALIVCSDMYSPGVKEIEFQSSLEMQYDLAAELSSHVSLNTYCISVLGLSNKIPQTGWLEQQIIISS